MGSWWRACQYAAAAVSQGHCFNHRHLIAYNEVMDGPEGQQRGLAWLHARGGGPTLQGMMLRPSKKRGSPQRGHFSHPSGTWGTYRVCKEYVAPGWLAILGRFGQGAGRLHDDLLLPPEV